MGLARGDAPCCSTEERKHKRFISKHYFFNVFVNAVKEMPLPAGMMTDRAVAEADLITLVPGLELRFSPSESCWWRTLRSTRSVVAPRVPGGSGSPRMVALLGRGSDASAGLNSLSVIRHER